MSDGEPATRATGASLAAVLLVGVSFGAVMLLHVVRRDVDPLRQVMSEYANGAHGVVMTVAFYAFGLACLALAVRIRRAIDRRGAARPLPVLLGLSGVGLVLSGAFEVGRPNLPDTLEEVIHSTASVSAFVLLIVSMLLLSLACRSDPRWWTFRWTSTALAAVAAASAALSPVADHSAWAGVVQRVLGLSILAWLLLTARRIRSNARRREGDDDRSTGVPTTGRAPARRRGPAVRWSRRYRTGISS